MLSNVIKLYKSLLYSNLQYPEGASTEDYPKVALLGSGGGSGIEQLLKRVEAGDIKMKVEALVSSREGIGVETHATDFAVECEKLYNFPKREVIPPFKGNFSPQNISKISTMYRNIMEKYNLDYLFLSGWLKFVLGIEFNKVINIHPGPTQGGYGGEKMHGDAVHEKIWEDYKEGKINQTCVTMHYATDKFDDSRFTIVQVPVSLVGCNNVEDVQKKVNAMEHEVQWMVTELITSGAITWSGDKKDKVQVDYEKVNKFDFPEGTKFAENLDLQDGIPYQK